MDDISELMADWPVDTAAVGLSDVTGVVAAGGQLDWAFDVASVTKLFTAYAGLVAIEEGTISLGDSVGPPGCTVEHLLSHTSGFGFDDSAIHAAPGGRRIYSNIGIEVFGDHLAMQSGLPVAEYVHEAVFQPLHMLTTALTGSPARGAHATVRDLLAFGRELLKPTLVSPETLAEAVVPHFPHVAGVVPGVGRFDPCPWGLGFEIRGDKAPHWTGANNTPLTFGHFGGSGAFLWVDPERQVCVAAITDREFGPWALEVWPPLSDELLYRYTY